MEAKDFRKQIIKKGSTVKYMGTYTRGKVQDIEVRDDEIWIKIDSTGLYYRSDHLLVICDEINLKSSRDEKPHEKIKKLKKIAPTQISDHGDGPGYGGG